MSMAAKWIFNFLIRIEFDEKAEMKSKPTWVIFEKCTRIDLNTIYGVWYNKIISRVSFKPSMTTDVIFHVLPLSIFTCIPPLIRTLVKLWKTRTISLMRSLSKLYQRASTAEPRCEFRKFKKKSQIQQAALKLNFESRKSVRVRKMQKVQFSPVYELFILKQTLDKEQSCNIFMYTNIWFYFHNTKCPR